METSTQDGSVETAGPEAGVGPDHIVAITVNEHPVTVARRTTGLEIKQSAIAQGVNIQLDFILSEEHGNGRTTIVGDQDEVRVHPGSRFVAIPNDDNS